MEYRGAASLGQPLEPPAQLGHPPRTFEQTPAKRTQIEPGAANDDRQPSPAYDAFDRWNCPSDEIRRRELFGRRHDVEQVMRNTSTRIRWQFGGPDVHPTIYLKRVAVDDLPIEGPRENKRELALARPRRTNDRDEIAFRSVGVTQRLIQSASHLTS